MIFARVLPLLALVGVVYGGITLENMNQNMRNVRKKTLLCVSSHLSLDCLSLSSA